MLNDIGIALQDGKKLDEDFKKRIQQNIDLMKFKNIHQQVALSTITHRKDF